MAANITLPGAAHSMFLGMIAAMLLQAKSVDWSRHDMALRVLPVGLLVAVLAIRAAEGAEALWFHIAGVPLVSLAAAIYLMSIVRGAPEAERLTSPALKLLGRLSYGIYLLHMPVLGLMHGLILGGRPDIGTAAQIGVTLAAVPVAIAVAWIVNRTIEQPMIDVGRRWRFAKPVNSG
jgi:peptidoglycan/LPS O-acetylase OafA/YrhL